MTSRALLAALPALLLAGACASTPRTPDDHDVELVTGVVALPGVGGFAGLTQRMWEGPRVRADVEAELVYQRLDDDVNGNGDVGDDLAQFRFGFRLTRPGAIVSGGSPGEASRWVGRFGATWMRFQGDPVYLDEPLDYGGVYAGVGWEFAVGKRWVMGPHATVHWVTSESDGGTGLVPELAWRFAWKL